MKITDSLFNNVVRSVIAEDFDKILVRHNSLCFVMSNHKKQIKLVDKTLIVLMFGDFEDIEYKYKLDREQALYIKESAMMRYKEEVKK